MIKDQRGVTIVELLIAVAVAAMISTVMLVMSLNFFGSTIRSQVTAEMSADAHYMLRAIIEDIRVADNIGVETVLPDPNEPVDGWITNDANNILVLDLPAIDSSRNIIYDTNSGVPFTNEVVYYIDSENNFYKRLIKNEAAPDNTLVTTCPPTPTTPGCPTDRKYAGYVTDMSFTFFDNGNSVTTDPLQARSVEASITMQRSVFGSPVTISNSIFTKLRN